MSTDLQTAQQGQTPMLRIANTVAELKANVQMVQHVMRDLMVPGTHYGKIPGTDKPTLFQPGAEIICLAFHWATRYAVEDLSYADVVRYRVTCELYSRDSGEFIGSGQGEASSDEEKYRWRRAVCDDEFEAIPEDRRRVKWAKGKGGSTYTTNQVRTEPADIANTVLKMGSKRALIAATRTASGCSDMFAQDLEDLPDGVREAVTGTDSSAQEPVQLVGEDWPALVKRAAKYGYSEDDITANAAVLGFEGVGAQMPREIANRIYATMKAHPREKAEEKTAEPPDEPEDFTQGEVVDDPEPPGRGPSNVTPLHPDAPATPQQMAQLKAARKAANVNAAEFNSLVSEYGGEPTADGYGLSGKAAGFVVAALQERAQ